MSAAPTPAPVTASAAFDAAQDAVEHTRRRLFPFDARRWITLGFVAFLDQCGRGGGFGGQVPGPGGTGGGGGGGGNGGQIEAGLAWLAAHVVLVSIVAAFVLAFVVAMMALVLWVNSRGVFVYLDDVATGRAEVARPWREHAAHASSYFAWSFALTMVTLTTVLLLVAAGAVIVFFMVRGSREMAVGAIVLIVMLLFALVGFVVLAALASLALRDFVAPLQLATGRPCGDAVRLLGALVRAHPGLFALYLVLKLCVAMVIAFAALVVGCCTCCCGFLPVVSQTILQPAWYFDRAWPVHVLRRLGYVVPVPAEPATA